MKILLFGKNGQLGWELQRTLAPLGVVLTFGSKELDLEDLGAVRAVVREARPQIIVNAAAYTAVDKAESEPDKAYAINGNFPGLLAEEAKLLSAGLMHYSTDYVFDGKKETAYSEADATCPINVYGASKLAGEQAIEAVGGSHLILRTSWVYSLRRDSFVTKVLGWARQQETLRVVKDQVSSPTWARMLAEATAQVMVRGVDYLAEHSGVYHLAGSGFASRYEWAKQILADDPNRQEHLVRELHPVSSSDFPTPAQRPHFSALDCERFSETFGLRLPVWEAALVLALGENVQDQK